VECCKLKDCLILCVKFVLLLAEFVAPLVTFHFLWQQYPLMVCHVQQPHVKQICGTQNTRIFNVKSVLYYIEHSTSCRRTRCSLCGGRIILPLNFNHQETSSANFIQINIFVQQRSKEMKRLLIIMPQRRIRRGKLLTSILIISLDQLSTILSPCCMNFLKLMICSLCTLIFNGKINKISKSHRTN
jgi:hypothetical protein